MDLKEESEDGCLTEKVKEFQIDHPHTYATPLSFIMPAAYRYVTVSFPPR